MSWGPPFLHASLVHWWIPFTLVPAVLLGLAWLPRLRPWQRRAYVAMLAVIVTGFGAVYLARTAHNVVSPPDWDMKVFWLWGRVAATGENVYSPAATRAVAAAAALRPDDSRFADFVLDVGFHYPPPAILLVAPFGFFDLRTGTLLWYVVQLTALAAAVWLLWRGFFADQGALGLLIAAALLVCLRATYTTLALGQTNFLALVLLLLFWRDRLRPRGGIALGLGLVVKPFFALLLPYLVLRRQWGALGLAAATVAALSGLTLLLFGPEQFAAYAAENPVARLPRTLYVFAENQSLLAGIVRATDIDLAAASPLAHPYYLAAAATVAVITALLAWEMADRDEGLALALLLAATLLVYPQSWEHYTVLLIVPIALLWTRRHALGLGTPAAIVLLGAVYALNRYQRGAVVLWGTLLLWAALSVLALRRVWTQQGAQVWRYRANDPALPRECGGLPPLSGKTAAADIATKVRGGRA